MKTQFEYIHFTEIQTQRKTKAWSCQTNSSNVELGQVKWYGAWHQFCFFPSDIYETVYSVGCLKDIIEFIEQAANERRTKQSQGRDVMMGELQPPSPDERPDLYYNDQADDGAPVLRAKWKEML